jgi:hypothetical protein
MLIPDTVDIANKTFSTQPIPDNIQFRLNKLFKKRVSFYEIAPERNEKITLISKMIGPYAINTMIRLSRFYQSPEFTKEINKIRNYKIPDMGVTVDDVVQSLQKRNIKVFLHGGLIRDIFLGVKSTDIDLVFDADVSKIVPICQEEGYPCADIMIREQYINFGKDKGASLEGSNLKNSYLVPLYAREATVNDFSYDLQNDIIIDAGGHGLQDVLYRKIRLTPYPHQWKLWAKDWKKPFRYFKLIQKGFKPMHTGINDFVVNYITDNYDSVYDKEITKTYPIKRIKHFLVSTITNGVINPDGSYQFGPNEHKIIPYLEVLKQHLPPQIFQRILSSFSKDDLKKFKDKKVASNITSLLKSVSDKSSVKVGKTTNKTKIKTHKSPSRLGKGKKGKTKKISKTKSNN